MHLRLFLQPSMAAIFAIRDGVRDAREGRPPYSRTMFTDPEERRHLLAEGWKSDGRVVVMSAIMDAVYQFIALRWVHPIELVVVVVVIAWAPYAILRGVVNRLMRWRESKKAGT
jgi:hypothetical protein